MSIGIVVVGGGGGMDTTMPSNFKRLFQKAFREGEGKITTTGEREQHTNFTFDWDR